MISVATLLMRFRRCRSGAAAVEFALIGTLLILVCLGTVELGRGLHMRNKLSHAADLAARRILITPDAPAEEIESLIRSAFPTGDPDALIVDTSVTEQDEGGPMEFRVLSVTYSMSLLVPGLSNGDITLAVNRRVPIT